MVDTHPDENTATSGPVAGASLLRPGAVTPREYQLAIVKDAVEMNTLVVLPTGLGKTLVSALAAAQLLERNLDMRVLIMAPTRPLVLQHRESYLRYFTFEEDEMVVMTGEVHPEMRAELWCQGRIFFTTPQVVENDIAKGRLSLGDFCLVVFDEAHRAVKEYAYTAIAKHYMENGTYPLLLGLTASPGGNKDRVQEVCEALSIERIVYRSHEDEDVSPYVHDIETEWREVKLPEVYGDITRLLRRMLDDRIDKLRGYLPAGDGGPGQYVGKRTLLTIGDRMRERLNSTPGPERGPIFGAMMLQSAALSILHAVELLESQGIRCLMRFLNRIEDEKNEKRAYKNIVKDAHYPEMYKLVSDNVEAEHPKVEALKLEIVGQYGKEKRSKVLVFTQYRDTAQLLTSALKNDVFVVERFVGQASRLGDEGLDQAAQQAMLERFRNGEITVLVATSVAEEGLDIPDVDVVVFYEPIPSEIRFIQRKGRTGRSRVGRVVILAAEDSVDTAYHRASQRKVKRMRELMSSMNTTLARVQRGPRPPPTPAKAVERPVVRQPLRLVEDATIDRARPVAAMSEGMPRGPERHTKAQLEARQSRIPPSPHPTASAAGALTETKFVREWVMELLERKDELYIEDLFERGSEDGIDPGDLQKVLEALREEGQVFKPSWDVVKKVKERKDASKDVHEITVLRVVQGCALVVIDDAIEALLEPEEIPGGPGAIKKGRTFRARAKLYESEGKKYLRVFELFE